MTNVKMARTLQAIADGGREAFYRGALARDIVKDVQDAGERTYILIVALAAKKDRMQYCSG